VKSGEIWRYPFGEGKHGIMRVVLRVQDLCLSASDPLAFVNSAFLVQMVDPRLHEGTSFPKGKAGLLVNGMFLAGPGKMKAAGFQRVGFSQVSLDEIEFPCWLIRDARKGVLLCRGEINAVIGSAEAETLYAKWDIRLTPFYPDQALRAISDLISSRQSSPSTGDRHLWGIPASDLRYHPQYDLALKELGGSFDQPYLSRLSQVHPSRLEAYVKAIEQ
jgi:hypothetical protein